MITTNIAESRSSRPSAVSRLSSILVIDDDLACREAICQILSDEGFNVSSAENGRAGVEQAMLLAPVLVLCDVRMPVMDGYDTLVRLRGMRATADVPFVFLSAGADLKDVRRGMNLGADDYLVKPFSADELLSTVRARLKRVPAMEISAADTLAPTTHRGQTLELLGTQYRVVSRVNRGNHSAVYEAFNLADGAAVAVKFLAENASIDRFDRECAILASLRHPRVVRYHERGVTKDGDPFLVMDWLPGHDLATLLGKRTLSIDEGIGVMRHVAEALAAIHTAKVVHRDIKPSNLFLVGGDINQLTLIDFGIARRPEASVITLSGDLLGTMGFLAPEQVEQAGTADARSDVFSLACTVYACFAGSSPFHGATTMASLFKLLFEDIPSVRSVRPEVPEALDALLRAMLDRDPALRPPNGQAVLDALGAIA